MPGMNSGLNPADPTLVAAFRSALFHQGAIALIAIVFLWLIWATARTWRVAPPAAKGAEASAAGGKPEARGRRLLRVGFGVLWIFDGILQAQPKMAGGLASQVIEPTRGGIADMGPAPGQLGRHRLVLSPHPGRRRQRLDPGRHRRLAHRRITRVLVQARRGGQRRLGPGRLGVRGVVRRDLRARPELADRGARRRAALRGRGGTHRAAGGRLARPAARAAAAGRRWGSSSSGWRCFRPGRAAVSGKARSDGKPGTLSGMVQSMSGTPQPHFLSSLLSAFGSFAASNGFAVNLVVVITLAAIGAIFLTGQPGWSGTRYGSGSYSAWPTGCWCRTSASWAASGPTRTA